MAIKAVGVPDDATCKQSQPIPPSQRDNRPALIRPDLDRGHIPRIRARDQIDATQRKQAFRILGIMRVWIRPDHSMTIASATVLRKQRCSALSMNTAGSCTRSASERSTRVRRGRDRRNSLAAIGFALRSDVLRTGFTNQDRLGRRKTEWVK